MLPEHIAVRASTKDIYGCQRASFTRRIPTNPLGPVVSELGFPSNAIRLYQIYILKGMEGK